MLTALLLSPAWASAPVLNLDEGAEPDLRSALGEDIEVIRWADLSGQGPRAEGAAALQWCASAESTPVDAQSIAEDHLAYMRWSEALQTLDEALAKASCDPLSSGAELARLHFLRGLAAAEAGQADASGHYEAALALDAELDWDESWSPRHKEAFELVRSGLPETVQLSLSSGAAVRIDGEDRAGELSLMPGAHHVVVDGQVASLMLEGDAVLVVPGPAPEDPNAAQPALQDWLDRAHPEPLRVASSGQVWERSDPSGWSVVASYGQEAPVEQLRRGPVAVSATGAGLAIAGGVLIGIGRSRSVDGAAEGSSATDWSSYDASLANWESGTRMVGVGVGVLATGGALGAAGLGWSRAGVSVTPTARGVRLEVTR